MGRVKLQALKQEASCTPQMTNTHLTHKINSSLKMDLHIGMVPCTYFSRTVPRLPSTILIYTCGTVRVPYCTRLPSTVSVYTYGTVRIPYYFFSQLSFEMMDQDEKDVTII